MGAIITLGERALTVSPKSKSLNGNRINGKDHRLPKIPRNRYFIKSMA